MPRHDPFTAFCRQAAAVSPPRLADLHAHTTASDGDLTPAQLVAAARQRKVLAVAVTDHDTVAGINEALRVAEGVDVVPGVELSASFRGREVHLLGFYINPTHAELVTVLTRLCDRRRERFRDYVAKIGVALPIHVVSGVEADSISLGRRHVASLLLNTGAARTRADAFRRFLDPCRENVMPKKLLPVGEAIALVRTAGGVAALAHPPSNCDRAYLEELKSLGLAAVEAVYPAASNRQTDFLRETARTLGLVVTGGSDTHDMDCPGRRVGDLGVGPDDLAALRAAAGRP
jgi:predicted metal-dependent phosphoesterase TrpH